MRFEGNMGSSASSLLLSLFPNYQEVDRFSQLLPAMLLCAAAGPRQQDQSGNELKPRKPLPKAYISSLELFLFEVFWCFNHLWVFFLSLLNPTSGKLTSTAFQIHSGQNKCSFLAIQNSNKSYKYQRSDNFVGVLTHMRIHLFIQLGKKYVMD